MKTHIIENSVVVNTILATLEEAQAAFPDAVCIDGAMGGIGWTWDGATLSAPEAPATPAPQSVTMRQARLALFGINKLSDVDSIIAAMPSPQKDAALIEWEYSSEVWRNKPLVQALGPALGMTEAEIDALFIQAATL